MKYYLLNYPRPIGVEPRVYFEKPNIIPEITEVEPGYFLEDPFSNPDVIEFESIKDALKYIIEFNDTDNYLKHLEILRTEP